MQKESNDLYYEVMMSDHVTLGKGHYERGNNASVEEINYQRGDISAVGTMSLSDDWLKIILQYQILGLEEKPQYYLETKGFELINESLQLENGELELTYVEGLIEKASISAQAQTWQLQKDDTSVLLKE